MSFAWFILFDMWLIVFDSKQKHYTPQRQDDINNNDNDLKSYQPRKLIETPPKPPKITLDAQFVGDDFFRTLACDSTSQGLDRSKPKHLA